VVTLDGKTLGNCHVWANLANVHMPFVSKRFVVRGIAGGGHTIILTAISGTITDPNDNFNVTIEEQLY
jgi:hypothetical protein